MELILISACLLGRPVRYNGTSKTCDSPDIIGRWSREGRLVPLCPEVAAGFSTPRPPAEIVSELRGDGAAVLAGAAWVMDSAGVDVTDLFVKGAGQAVEMAQRFGCRHAVLTDGSPSCGSSFVYDGTFSGTAVPGIGATTAALQAAGVRVWSQTAVPELDALLSGRDQPPNTQPRI